MKGGKAAAFLRADKPGNGAVLTQMVAPGDFAGKRVRLSGQVKTSGADPGAGLWMRVDNPDGSPSFDNMSDRKVAGDTIVCDQCGRVYPIRDGIPEMLVESATIPGRPPKEEPH